MPVEEAVTALEVAVAAFDTAEVIVAMVSGDDSDSNGLSNQIFWLEPDVSQVPERSIYVAVGHSELC